MLGENNEPCQVVAIRIFRQIPVLNGSLQSRGNRPHLQRFEFAYEKTQLLKILDAAWKARTADAWKPHPMFGKMTPKEWGKLLQIHTDYHLRQFGA